MHILDWIQDPEKRSSKELGQLFKFKCKQRFRQKYYLNARFSGFDNHTVLMHRMSLFLEYLGVNGHDVFATFKWFMGKRQNDKVTVSHSCLQ